MFKYKDGSAENTFSPAAIKKLLSKKSTVSCFIIQMRLLIII